MSSISPMAVGSYMTSLFFHCEFRRPVHVVGTWLAWTELVLYSMPDSPTVKPKKLLPGP